ncbi:hypothetical protein GCM10011395_35050 [Sphingomonas psychrolutea]|uniref:Uncharacterized protein n=1 Tax=Sphingomonas psychrolutea TaxID=1259676 RepID=A0ABQ1H723_9SPHN|nr:hypothetical protein GCM10011395_35050 [Sphingomonas psychrolutea]
MRARAIEIVDVTAAIEIIAADHELERPVERRDQAGFLHDHIVTTVRVEPERDRRADIRPRREGARKIDIEALVEMRIGGRTGQLGEVEFIFDRAIDDGLLAGEAIVLIGFVA